MLCAPGLYAAADPADPFDDSPRLLEEDLGLLASSWDWFLHTRNSWIDRVEGLASSIDGFLANSDTEDQINESYTRFSFEQYWGETEGFTYNTRVKLKLHLPETKKRWRYFIENLPDEQESLESREDPSIRNKEDGTDPQGFFAGVAKERQVGHWVYKRRLGLRFRLPPQPFISFALDRTFPLENLWQARFENRLFYYHDGDRGTRHTLYFERPLSSSRFLRFRSAARWLDNGNSWEYSQSAHIQKKLDDNRALLHSAGVLGTNQPNARIEQYYLNIRYRQRLYEDWLFADLTPQLHWKREDGFHYRWGFFARLEILFAE